MDSDGAGNTVETVEAFFPLRSQMYFKHQKFPESRDNFRSIHTIRLHKQIYQYSTSRKDSLHEIEEWNFNSNFRSIGN